MIFSILRRHRPLYAPVTGGGGGIMQYLTPSATDTLDPANPNTDPSITLSGGNLTALATATASHQSRSLVSHTTGKYYVEVTVVARDAGNNNMGAGLCDSSFVMQSGFLGGDAHGICYYSTPVAASGAVFLSNANLGYETTSAQVADVICMAIDLDNRKIWWRINNGAWNNNQGGSPNPATNTAGADISGFASTVYVALDLEITAQKETVNFTAATTGAFASPSGAFVNW